jgi:hypothetical protein
MAVISAAEVQNVRSREILLRFHMLVYRCGFRYCIQTSNRILVPVLCVVLPGVGGNFLQFLPKHVGVNK